MSGDDIGPKGRAALAYAAIGWSVFPVAPDGKAPRTPHGFLDATDDAEIIRGHWTRHPDDNIGLALVASGLCAVDEDPRNGGDEELEAAEIELGPLPRACVASTAGGGRHFLMRPPAGRRPRGKVNTLPITGEKCKGLDFKQNGYVLVEPSDKLDGRAYKWIELDVENVPEVPAAWLEALYHPDAGDAEAPDAASIETWSTDSDPEITDDDAARLRRYLRGLGSRAEGKNTTYRAVAAIFHDWGLGVDSGWPYLVEWNANCGEPHQEHELHRQMHRVASRAQLGKRGRARRDIPLSQQIARAAVMVDPVHVEEEESPTSDDDEDDGSPPAARVMLTPSASPTRDIDAEISAALDVVIPPPAASLVEAHLLTVARRWARSSSSPRQVEAGKAIHAALKMKWTPPPNEDAAVAVAHLATALVEAVSTPIGKEQPPQATDTQLAAYLPFRSDGSCAIAAARAAPVISIGSTQRPPPDPEGQGPIDVVAWGDSWELDREGVPKPSRTNVILALHRMDIEFSFDLLAQKKMVRVAGGDRTHVSDPIVDELWDAIEGRYRFQINMENFRRWIGVRSAERAYHPVKDYLASLTWDGTSRVDNWLQRYTGAADTPLNRAIGKIVLVAAVRRMRNPGCKFDEILVLEGPQGSGKSSIVQILARQPDWYGSSVPFHRDERRQLEAIEGKWIIEASELAGLSRAESEAFKEFCSRPRDEARKAYGHEDTRLDRQCIFIGTTNADEYLPDRTGSRRVWPVLTGAIDLDAFRADIDQLWAEAVQLEEAGESIRLDPSLYADAGEEQAARRVIDAYELALEDAGIGPVEDGGLCGKIRKVDVLALLGISVADANLSRVTSILRRLGWKSSRMRFGGGLGKGDGARAECYARGDGPAREVELKAQGRKVIIAGPGK